jgi:TolB-like protein
MLFLDPLNEKAWRAVMRAYADQGDPRAAIEAFEQCRDVLRNEIDAEPSADTRNLLENIRDAKAGSPRTIATERPAGPEWDAPRVGPRVGVLPLDCGWLPPEEAFLGPAIARAIIARLCRFFRIAVTGADALAGFARDADDTAAIRRALGIDYLLRGTIQHDRDRLRVSLRLLDLRAEDRVVWADRFDRQVGDLEAAQNGIAAEAVARVEPELQIIEALRNQPPSRAEPTANELLISSIAPMLRMERAGFMLAGQNLARGVALEPNFCDVHSWYSFWHVLLVSQGWTAEPRQALRRGGELADRAVALNPVAVRALTIRGLLHALQGFALSEAAALYDRALEINPNLAMTWALSAVNCFNMGDIEEAQRRYDTYKTLSPHHRLAFFLDALFAPIHVVRRDYQAAITTGNAVMQLNPGFSAGYKPYLAALGHLRHHDEAAALLRRLLTIEPNFTVARFMQTTSMRRQSDRDHFMEGLRLAGVPDCSAFKPAGEFDNRA